MEERDDHEKKLDKIDSYLTRFGIILKKHWGKLLLILCCYFVYWALNQPDSPPEPIPEVYDTELYDSTYVEYEDAG